MTTQQKPVQLTHDQLIEMRTALYEGKQVWVTDGHVRVAANASGPPLEGATKEFYDSKLAMIEDRVQHGWNFELHPDGSIKGMDGHGGSIRANVDPGLDDKDIDFAHQAIQGGQQVRVEPDGTMIATTPKYDPGFEPDSKQIAISLQNFDNAVASGELASAHTQGTVVTFEPNGIKTQEIPLAPETQPTPPAQTDPTTQQPADGSAQQPVPQDTTTAPPADGQTQTQPTDGQTQTPQPDASGQGTTDPSGTTTTDPSGPVPAPDAASVDAPAPTGASSIPGSGWDAAPYQARLAQEQSVAVKTKADSLRQESEQLAQRAKNATGDEQTQLQKQADDAKAQADQFDKSSLDLRQRSFDLSEAYDNEKKGEPIFKEAQEAQAKAEDAQHRWEDTTTKQGAAWQSYHEAQGRVEALTGNSKIVQEKVADLSSQIATLEKSGTHGDALRASQLRDEMTFRQKDLGDINGRLVKAEEDVTTYKQQSDTLYQQAKDLQADATRYGETAAQKVNDAWVYQSKASELQSKAYSQHVDDSVIDAANAPKTTSDLSPDVIKQVQDETGVVPGQDQQQPTGTDTQQPTEDTTTTPPPTDDAGGPPPATNQTGDDLDASQDTSGTQVAMADGLAPDPDALDAASIAPSNTGILDPTQQPAGTGPQAPTGADDQPAAPTDTTGDIDILDRPPSDNDPTSVNFPDTTPAQVPDVSDQPPENPTPEIPDITTQVPDTDGGTLPDIQEGGPDDGSSSPGFGQDQPTDTDPVSVGASDPISGGGSDDGSGGGEEPADF